MGNVRIVVNRKTVAELLKSPAVKADLERRAQAIATAAGDGMEVDSEVGPNRARASVRTATYAARRAEAKDRALTKALGAGRH